MSAGPTPTGQADVRPYWYERQHDLSGPDFEPGVVGRADDNITHRSWTLVGTRSTVDRAIVDPRGLVTPGAGWSVDWWVGADDRWHTPATEAGVRQRLVDDTPVIETLMRIPGGDAVQRVYAIHATAESPFGQDFVVIEVENRSAVPFAVAFAVLPANPIGPAPVASLALGDASVLVDGRAGLLLPRPPARSAAVAGDVSAVVMSGEATSSFERLDAPAGDGEAAVIFPLPHTASIRVVMPIGDAPNRRTRRRPAPDATYPAAVPTAEQVAAGWALQTQRDARIAVPDPGLQTVFDANRRLLVLGHGGEDLASWPNRPPDWVEAEIVLGALDRLGFHEEVTQVLATLPEHQALDGSFGVDAERPRVTAAALAAVGDHWRLSRDDVLTEKLVGVIAKAVHWLERARTPRRGSSALSGDELVAAARALGLAAEALDGVDQPEVAADARRFADSASTDAASHPSLRLEESDVAVVDPVARSGLSPLRTLALASEEVAHGDSRALDRLAWVRSVMSPTAVWPEVVHPRTGGGSRGDGHHVAAGAAFLSLVRDLLVRETPTGLDLCSVVPADWLGQSIEVHDLPTAWGRLSYAVRWHGERPALLWELDRHDNQTPAILRAPGLDPGWQSDDARGDALLAAPERSIPTTAPIGDPVPDPAAESTERVVEVQPPIDPAPGGSFS